MALTISLVAVAWTLTITYAQANNKGKTKENHQSFSGEALPRFLADWKGEPISFRKPDGLILSEGNVYFTSHDDAGATLWRTGLTSVPGQETVLYWEQGARFGDIVYAEVDHIFFGSFLATKAGVITIRRIPLTGGAATVLATITNVDVANSHHNLITDGVNLYWQDDRSVRKMPIRGGAVKVLDATSPNTPTAGLSFQRIGKVLIYADGAAIRFLPLTGNYASNPQLRIIVTAASRVTTLLAQVDRTYWGEQSGAVKLMLGASTTSLHSTGGVPTSIATNGAAQVWTQCSGQACELTVDSNGTASTPIGADALGVTVPSSGKVYWGDAAGVHRLF
jgi:hypothetical protein